MKVEHTIARFEKIQEEIMKRTKLHILAMSMLLCMCTTVYAAETKQGALFPQTVGMTGKVTSKGVNIRNHSGGHYRQGEQPSYKSGRQE